MNGAQRSFAVERLFPPGVVAFEVHGDVSPEVLFPAERECVSRAVEKRVREFAAGRLCARAALAELGIEAAALPSRRDRVPLWPQGVVGSITHTEGYCLAVVGPRARFAAVGVDAEWVGRVDPALWRLTLSADELAALLNLAEPVRQKTAALIFGAKEAFYKCQYVLTRRWLGFEDVAVSLRDNAFSVTITDPTHPLHRIDTARTGYFEYAGELVIAAIALTADDLTPGSRYSEVSASAANFSPPRVPGAVGEAPSHELSSDQGMPSRSL